MSTTARRAGGRERGPRGLITAWVAVLLRPTRFFERSVSPGDQAPGLTFAVVVAGVYVLGWMVADPAVIPPIAEPLLLSATVVFLVVIALGAPVGLHLTAAVATLSLLVASVELDGSVSVRDRGGVSETVQVVAYASAPMALAGPPIPALRVLCALYAGMLLVIGLRSVHGTTTIRAIIAGLPPALVGYGVGYRAIAAARTLVDELAGYL